MKLTQIKKTRGFTMIELIIVISILGILAAFALPRFANFTTQARTATRDGIVAALNSSIGIAHAQWIANGSTGTVTLDGGTAITMNAAGYPNIAAAGTYNSAATCGTLVSALLSNNTGSTVGFTSPNCTVTPTNGAVITLSPILAN